MHHVRHENKFGFSEKIPLLGEAYLRRLHVVGIFIFARRLVNELH